MKESRNILGWLGVAEGHTAIQHSEEHIEETCKTVAFLSDAVRAFVSGDLSAKTIAIEKVKESERAADKVRATIVKDLTSSLLLPPDREDLMRFARALDKIADSTNSSARLLGHIEQRLPDNVLKNISISTEMIVSAVGKLRQAIHALGRRDFAEALRGCDDVERLEHEADDQKRLLLDAVLHAGLDPASLLLSYDLGQALENITDKIDNVAEMVRMFAVKSN